MDGEFLEVIDSANEPRGFALTLDDGAREMAEILFADPSVRSLRLRDPAGEIVAMAYAVDQGAVMVAVARGEGRGEPSPTGVQARVWVPLAVLTMAVGAAVVIGVVATVAFAWRALFGGGG